MDVRFNFRTVSTRAGFSAACARVLTPAGGARSSDGLINARLPQQTAQSTAAPPSTPTTPPAPQFAGVAPAILRPISASSTVDQFGHNQTKFTSQVGEFNCK